MNRHLQEVKYYAHYTKNTIRTKRVKHIPSRVREQKYTLGLTSHVRYKYSAAVDVFEIRAGGITDHSLIRVCVRMTGAAGCITIHSEPIVCALPAVSACELHTQRKSANNPFVTQLPVHSTLHLLSRQIPTSISIINV
ncbi:hypothetical protein J6590_070192 [Homalodisca vitripennis]|nr:hypothetical protein J6590_070192 [Homalodisca vitripennis]